MRINVEDKRTHAREGLSRRSSNAREALAAHIRRHHRACSNRQRFQLISRDALVLFYFQGLSYDEIAQSLEVPLGTVKSRIHNALSKLAGLLRPAEKEAEHA